MALESWQLDFAKVVARHRDEGLGWRYGDMKAWPTENIFLQLQKLGINADSEKFHQQAAFAGDFKALEKDWYAQLAAAGMDKEFWPDFPLIAIPILWQRLASDVICGDLVLKRLDNAISARQKSQPVENLEDMPDDVAAVLGLTQHLQGFAPVDRAARYDAMNRDGTYDYTSWLTDFIEERGPDWPDLAAQLGDILASTSETNRIQLNLAMALAIAGRRNEAISRATAVLKEFPNDEWNKILAADVYDELNDHAAAIRLLMEALPMVRNQYDHEAIVERLTEIFADEGRSAELEEILRLHPSPVFKRVSTEPEAYKALHQPRPFNVDPPRRFTPEVKIGRNEFCPCGSGKKYKKCCMP